TRNRYYKHISDESIMHLTNLTDLVIGDDADFPSQISNSSIMKLVKLRTLALRMKSKITYAGFSNLSDLSSLSLSVPNYGDSEDEEDFDEYDEDVNSEFINDEQLRCMTNLKSLDICGNDISNIGIRELTNLV